MLYGILDLGEECGVEYQAPIIGVHTNRAELQEWCDLAGRKGFMDAMVVELPDIPRHACVALLNILDHLGRQDLPDTIEMNRQQLEAWLKARIPPDRMSDAEKAAALVRAWKEQR